MALVAERFPFVRWQTEMYASSSAFFFRSPGILINWLPFNQSRHSAEVLPSVLQQQKHFE